MTEAVRWRDKYPERHSIEELHWSTLVSPNGCEYIMLKADTDFILAALAAQERESDQLVQLDRMTAALEQVEVWSHYTGRATLRKLQGHLIKIEAIARAALTEPKQELTL